MALKYRSNNYTLLHVYAYTVVVAAVVTIYKPDDANGAQYVVGGQDYKWSIPITNDFYSNWSSSHSFVVGDTLLFEYDPELHNLFQVSGREYHNCTAEQAFNVYNGTTSVPLMEHGVFYFVCTILNYCSLGQKLMVAVNKTPPASPPPSVAAPLLSPVPSPHVLQSALLD